MVKKCHHLLKWTSHAIIAFQQLKEHFTTAPILCHPDPSLPFTIEVDASSTGLGAVLSQRQGNPPQLYTCAFHSRKLTAAERNYDVGDRELLAMKAAFEEWRHWLEGATHQFVILTDHKNREYLHTAKRLNPCQAWWSLFLSRFHFIVTYCPGSKNVKADALSRQFEGETNINPETIIPASLIVSPLQWDIMAELDQANAERDIPADCPPDNVYVLLNFRNCIMESVHSSLTSGHPELWTTDHGPQFTSRQSSVKLSALTSVLPPAITHSQMGR